MSSIPPPPGSPPPFGSPAPGSPPPPPPPHGYGSPPAYGAPSYTYPQQDSPPPYGYQSYGTGGNADYAGFGPRLGARIIDSLIQLAIMLPFIVAGVLLLRVALDDCYSYEDSDGTQHLECPPGAVKGGPLAIGIIIMVIGIILAVLLYCRWVGRGQTPGMKTANIRVVDQSTGAPIGTGRAVGRYFAQYLSSVVCYLGFLWMLWDSRKQTWHDKLVSSIVVKA